MRFVLFSHSLVSDWNHGNAHFLRGVMRELERRGHEAIAYEPRDGWSRRNLVATAGPAAVDDFAVAFPDLEVRTYPDGRPDLDEALDGADVVLVQDWNEPALVNAIARHRGRHGDYLLLLYDGHHRAVTAPDQIEAFELSRYDAVLAFGRPLRDAYLERGWARRAYVWHEAVDVSTFQPVGGCLDSPGCAAGERQSVPGKDAAGVAYWESTRAGEDAAWRGPAPPDVLAGLASHPLNGDGRSDLVWIGNWGDGDRAAELREFVLGPAARLGLRGHVHGVRYPERARKEIVEAGLDYAGWIPNHRVPKAFARHRVTVHVPRRAYMRRVPGVPTVRVFEALACGIPLVSAPWEDRDGLFRAGRDYLMAGDGEEMRAHLRRLLADPDTARELAASGLETVRASHTCSHRVDELMAIVDELEEAA